MAKFCGKTDNFSPGNRETLRINQFETSEKFKTITPIPFISFQISMWVGTYFSSAELYLVLPLNETPPKKIQAKDRFI